MRVGLIQSNYIPWRGYFDFIDDVDLFIFYDDVQYTKNDWRNRNVIKTSHGKKWLTIPVRKESLSQLIKDILIDYNQDWVSSHINRFTESYKTSPYFTDALSYLEIITTEKYHSISELNRKLIQDISDYLKIKTPFEVSWIYSPKGSKTERILDILQKVGATTYVSGPNADVYLDKEQFREYNISLEYKSYCYNPYPQQWGDFIWDVTILDLIANCGQDSHQFLKSTEKNRVIIP
jgi:hypothetical protein